MRVNEIVESLLAARGVLLALSRRCDPATARAEREQRSINAFTSASRRCTPHPPPLVTRYIVEL